MKTLKASKKTTRLGFTLIELLATLTIMAVIAAILFPFVTNYTKKANHDTTLRSLRILQDAMDRYRATQDSVDWQVASASYGLLSAANAQAILDELSQATNTNATLRLPLDGLKAETNVYIVSTTASTSDSSWEVLAYRRNVKVTGVDRKGRDIDDTNWNNGYMSGIATTNSGGAFSGN